VEKVCNPKIVVESCTRKCFLENYWIQQLVTPVLWWMMTILYGHRQSDVYIFFKYKSQLKLMSKVKIEDKENRRRRRLDWLKRQKMMIKY
jgi:hypothetical protein